MPEKIALRMDQLKGSRPLGRTTRSTSTMAPRERMVGVMSAAIAEPTSKNDNANSPSKGRNNLVMGRLY
jgi:chorismate-pyruvate lyase